jgi:heme A synthase
VHVAASPVPGLLPLVLLVAGLGSAVVVALALAALARRRSRSYVLVTLALATLLTRTVLGVLTVNHVLPPFPHHLLEHSLDAVTVALLLGAIYLARTVEPEVAVDE